MMGPRSSASVPREIRHYRNNRIAIIGSVDFYHMDSPALCDAIGRQLARELPEACILTGANAITQKRLSEAFCREHQLQMAASHDTTNSASTITTATPLVFHLAPVGYSCNWEYGKCITAGLDMDQRRTILASCADACLAIEGGPGTVDEMKKAIAAGTVVLPLARTGGASGGMFDAPKPFVRPNYLEEHDWNLLFDTKADVVETACAVVRMIRSVLRAKKVRSSEGSKRTFEKMATAFLDAKYPKRPTLPGGFEYVEPTLADCAHLVYQQEGDNKPHGVDQSSSSRGSDGSSIYLGPKGAAATYENLAEAGIAAVVNCTKRVPCYFQHLGGAIQYFTVAVDDKEEADILPHLAGATEFMHSILKSGSSVLVHCEVGVSRSATVVMAYLIRYHDMSRDEAYLEVKKRRPKVNPNEGFWSQLSIFELSCRKAVVGDDDEAHPTATKNGVNHDDIEPPPPSQSTSVVPPKFDSDWAKTSCDMFAKAEGGDPTDALLNSDCFRMLSYAKNFDDLAFVCLDHVWGRGVKDQDVDWLCFICGIMNQYQGHGNNKGSMTDIVLSALMDKGSKFNLIWEGEIYDNQIKRVVDSLGEQRE